MTPAIDRGSARVKIPEIAQRLGVSEYTVYAMLEARDIPAIRVGRLWIVTRPAYLAWEQSAGMGRVA